MKVQRLNKRIGNKALLKSMAIGLFKIVSQFSFGGPWGRFCVNCLAQSSNGRLGQIGFDESIKKGHNEVYEKVDSLFGSDSVCFC